MINALIIGFVISVIVFHVCAIKRYKISSVVTKGIASAFFVGISAWMLYLSFTGNDLTDWKFPYIGNIYSKYYVYIFAGLVCGFFGDILLALRNHFVGKRGHFIASGMIAFGLGHLAYAVEPTFKLLAISPAWIVIPCIAGVALALIIWKISPRLGMEFGKFTIPVILYSTIILYLLSSVLMNCILCSNQSGFSIQAWIPFAPVLLFTVSDLTLSTNYFDKEQKPMSTMQIIVIHVTYYIAQLLFALGFSLS